MEKRLGGWCGGGCGDGEEGGNKCWKMGVRSEIGGMEGRLVKKRNNIY